MNDTSSSTVRSNGSTSRSLKEHLHEPTTEAALHRILDRMDRIEQALTTLTDAVDQAPAVAATLVDTMDDLAHEADARGVDLDQRMKNALTLAERLTAPKTVDALTGLLNRIDRIEQLTALLDQAPGFIAMMVDIADEWAAQAAAHGVDVETMLSQTSAAGRRLTELVVSSEFQGLLDSGVLDPRAMSVVGTAGHALVKCQEECLSQPEPPTMTLFGLLRAARQPEMQRALAFLANFGRFFGEAMETRHRSARPKALPTNGTAQNAAS